MRPLVSASLAAVALFSLLLVLFFVFGGDDDDRPVREGRRRPVEVVAPTAEPPGGASRRDGADARSPGGRTPSPRPSPRSRARPEPATEAAEGDGGAVDGLPLPAGKSTLSVEVLDSTSSPREGFVVTLLSGPAREQNVSDRQGLAVFPDIAAGSYSFRVEGEGLPEITSAREVALVAGEEKVVTVTVGAFGLELAGRVLDRDGQPVPDIEIFARKQLFQVQEGDHIATRQDNLRTVTAADGTYRITGLEAADYLLRTKATEVYPSVRQIFRAGVQTADLVLDVTRDLEVFGVVASPAGEPVADVAIVPIGQASRQTRSDAHGRYSLLLALTEEKSAYALKTRRQGFKDAQVNILESEIGKAESWQVDISIEPLEQTVPVSGVVVDQDGHPVVGETVMLYSSALSGRHKATSDDQGRFSLGNVQVGDYRLWVYPRSGYHDYSREPVTVPEEGLDLDITLEAIDTGAVRGVLQDPLGQAIPRFTLWLRSMDALGNSVTVTSDSFGRFEVEDVPAGELIFETRSFPRLAVRGVRFDPREVPEVAEIVLTLDWGELAFEGGVVDSAETPVAGARVTLSWSSKEGGVQSTSIRHAVTDADGRFVFSELAPVDHKISVSAPGYRTQQAEYSAADGEAGPVVRLRSKDAAGSR